MENDIKNCPYCGGEILAIAKKCKHCGRWLNENEETESETVIQNETSSEGDSKPETFNLDEEKHLENNGKSHVVVIIIEVILVVSIFIIGFSIKNGSNRKADDYLAPYDTVKTIEETYEQSYLADESPRVYQSSYEEDYSSLASARYKQKQEEVHIADIHVMYEDGKKIWYNYWTSETQSGFSNMLYEYDSETDRESIINLNKTNEDEFYVDDMACNNGIITIIMSEFRNSNGWLEGTFVWQYNCETGSWKPLAKACSGAKFVNNRRSVKIDNAYCINPDEPTFLQEYRHRYKTIKL